MNPQPAAASPRMTPDALAALGVGSVAYIRPVSGEANTEYEIHGADGSLLARTPSLARAIGAIQQNNMEPTFAH